MSNKGYTVPPYDPTDYVPKAKSMGHMSTRSIKQLASGNTAAEFQRLCDAGLSTVDDMGRELHGQAVYDEFSNYCKE